MQWLAELSVRRGVFAAVLMLAIVVVGLAGYRSLGVDSFPKVDFPVVSVTTRLDGAAPEEVETEITDKVEAAVNTISGIDELRSVSSEGVSQVFVTFQLEKNVDVGAQDVRDKVQTVLRDLPEGTDQPVIQKMDPDASPVLFVAVKSNRPVREMTELADKKIRRDIENTPGVGQVSLIGGRSRQVNVWLDVERLRAYGLTASEVQRSIAAQNLSVPAGSVETGPRNVTLRVRGRVGSADALMDVVVRQKGASPIRLRDVARVEDGEEEEYTAASLDGKPALVLSIRKQSGENTVAVVEAVRQRLEQVRSALPPGYDLSIVRDASRTIQTQVNAVKEHLILGAIFAALVVLLFLGNIRSTVIAALAIPVSIIGTFALMAYMGFTLNIVTLLALALAVGIVIDDAIVVLENVHRFIEQKRMKPFPAAIHATRDIGLAVLATTLSLIAVFLPVAFMSGLSGRFLNSFGVTMAFAIGVSLLVSFTITPMLAARWLQPPSAGEHKRTVLERIVDRFYYPIERLYMTSLRWAMRHRWTVVIGCLVALGSCVPLAKAVPKGFLPPNDEAEFEMNVRTPEGASLRSTLLAADRISRETRRVPGVAYTLTTIGDNDARSQNLARIYVKLTDPADRNQSQQEIRARVRRDVVAHQSKELRIDVSDIAPFNSGSSSKTVQYVVNGPDIRELGRIAEEAMAKLRSVPGAVDVDSNLILGKPESQMEVLRNKAADLGVQVADISNASRLVVGGLDVSNYAEGGEEYAIRMRADSKGRDRVEVLGMLPVPSTRVGSVALRDVVRFHDENGPSEINRLNRRRQVLISANVLPGFGDSDVLDALTGVVKGDVGLPQGYSGQASGRSRETGKASKNFVFAFLLSLVFMYLVLAAQFDSWLHPITILVSLPLTVPFALLSLLIFSEPLTIQSALGLLVLFGVVKKNSILQVDHTNNLRAQGVPRDEAIIKANKDRLRPILMTTVAFVAGMIPLITAKGIGAGYNRNTAGPIVGGQVLSLVLTLLATPVVYSLLDDLVVWTRMRTGRRPIDRGELEIQREPTA